MLKIHCPGCGVLVEVPVSMDHVSVYPLELRVVWRPSQVMHKCYFPNPNQDKVRP